MVVDNLLLDGICKTQCEIFVSFCNFCPKYWEIIVVYFDVETQNRWGKVLYAGCIICSDKSILVICFDWNTTAEGFISSSEVYQ